MPSEQELFLKLVGLVGKQIEVATKSKSGLIKGTLANAMFDSFLVENEQGKHIVKFTDIVFLDTVKEKTAA